VRAKTALLKLAIQPEVKEALRVIADELGISLAAFVREAAIDRACELKRWDRPAFQREATRVGKELERDG
jgi:hypothetical protein